MAAACSSLLSLFPLSSPDRWPFWMAGRDRGGSLVLAGWAGWLCPGTGADDRQAGRCWRSVSPVVLAVSASLSVPLYSLPLAVVLCWPCLCVSTMAGGRLGGAVMISGAVPGVLVVLGLAVAVPLGSFGRKSSGMVYVKMHKNKASKSRYFYMLDWLATKKIIDKLEIKEYTKYSQRGRAVQAAASGPSGFFPIATN